MTETTTTRRTTARTRRWQLVGYIGKDKVHESTCIGDAALDEAMRNLERDGIRPAVRAQ